MCVFHFLFCVSSCDFTSSSSTLSGVCSWFNMCAFLCPTVYVHPKVCLRVYVCSVMYCASLRTLTSPSSPCAPPYLSPMEMRRGQGIWGEEHREAALHDLKGILMNQHSRTAYSHDNRPQTNSCIWSPLVLWLWKCCMCVSVYVCGCFCFWGTVSVCCACVCVCVCVCACACVHKCLPLRFF